jgi:carbonic anhydrase
MSCVNSNAPIDINNKNIAGKCDLKCNYSFQYNTSACVATNKGDYISLSYDNTSNPPVIYNDSGYNVKEVRLYSPSIHSYIGEYLDGELVIIHNSITGLNPLLVCVPIKVNDVDAIDSSILSAIIKTVSNNAPNKDETTNVNIQNYNLNHFVPYKPYFSYTANLMYQPCDGQISYIAFSPNQKYINISSTALEILQTITTRHKYTLSSNPPKLYFNEKGSKPYTTSNDIYIDCQPIVKENNLEEEKIVVTNINTQPFKPMDILKNPFFQFLMGMLFFLVIFYIVSWLFKFSGKFMNSKDNVFNNNFLTK